ncbi:pre-mRNA-splicing factor CWC25 homolog [Clupea harengus]|uniref:Pre-mRNA-splicing factor CWC25 homolog n=1 Tax=Clupea harengus TaxID=7950 RepID=A0A6P3WDE2_CLUHA|nr:pre-mRNA-splicing factor CWC25 homolog [Clupea harengus]
MGGGDLNLKKSWHPQTLKNIERVWKAEQKFEAERKKIEELQKELKDERAREELTKFAQQAGAVKKKDDRLDWMYQGPGGQISRDEYLLGRPVDKQILEQYEEPETGPCAQTGLLPGSIFNPNTPASNLDMAAKIREDPLFEIRKREEEKKRSVLSNPVKMKKIKEMLRQNLDVKDKKKKRKKDKKDRKEEKRERRKEKKHKRRDSSSGSEDDYRKPRSHAKDNSPSPPTSHHHHKPGYGLLIPNGRSHHSSAATDRSANHQRDRSRSPPSHHSHRDNHSSHDAERRGPPRRPPSPPKPRYQRPKHANHTKHASAEDLEKKRRQMMEFAQQRDEERESNVRRYRQQEEQEKARDTKKPDRHASFIHEMKLESAATSSVEDRVKRNIHSIQRTSASLEKNFMRR